MQLSVRGEGNEGPNGGINGDLIVVIEEIPHEDFVRDGQNVLYNLLVSFPIWCMEIPLLKYQPLQERQKSKYLVEPHQENLPSKRKRAFLSPMVTVKVIS